MSKGLGDWLAAESKKIQDEMPVAMLPGTKIMVHPKPWNHLIYFNFGPNGSRGTACWDTRAKAWKPVKGEVGEAQKSWLESEYGLGEG